jgi:DHA3 family macrolide efflux protein-like MFS transporter
MSNPRPSGMFAFTIVAIGQAVSFIGTGMTRFAVIFWAWQETGQATTLAFTGFFAFAPAVLVSPLAGALVDRWNRKLVMILSDLAAGLSTIALLILFSTDNLQIWHIYAAGAFAGAFEAFQWPAYSAVISTMLPKEQYTRANGMLSLSQSLGQILAPGIAGAMLAFIDIGGIMTIDVITFTFAILTILIVHIPQPEATAEGLAGRGNLLQESLYGFRYILDRTSLLALQLIFTGVNLTATFGLTVLPAMILARTNENPTILGSVQSAFGVGGVAGGLLLSTWGGPRRRIHGVLGGMIIGSLFGIFLIGLGHGVLLWFLGVLVFSAAIPMLNGSNQAIWQAKVPPDVQGRVFSVRRLIAQITAPIAMALAGPLADFVFEPAMQPGGPLAPVFGPITGTGAGTGMSVMFLWAGLLSALVGVAGYLLPFVREVEDILPDHDGLVEQPAPELGQETLPEAQI